MALLAAVALGAPAHAASPAGTPPGPSAASPATVVISRFEVQGNTLLPADRIDALLRPLTGTALTVAQMRAAAASVQEAYRDAGWGGVIAFLPEQTLEGGVLRIRVVEGRLARVDVKGAAQFSEDNVRASLPSLVMGQPLQVRRIDRELQMGNENPSKSMKLLLQPGAASGEIVAQVNVEERPVQRFHARAENVGSDATGRWRAALGWEHANLWGVDHVLSLEYQTAPDAPAAVRVVGAGYRVPFYARALALDAYAAWSDIDAGTVATAAGDLSFAGRGTVGGLRLGWYLPRQGNVDQRLSLSVESREYRNSCTLQGLPAGACGTAGASVSLQPARLGYTAQAAGTVQWKAEVSASANLGAGGSHGSAADFQAVRPNSRVRYSLLRGSLQMAAPLSESLSGSARLTAQYTAEPLVPGELMGIGGAQSVRGYGEREINGDRGAALSLELAGPNLLENLPGAAGADLRALVFADTAVVANADAASCAEGRRECRLHGAGFGLRVAWRSVRLRLDLAQALSAGPKTARGDLRAHVALSLNP